MIGNLVELKKELYQYNIVEVEVEEINQNSLKYSYPTIFKTHSVAFSENIVHFNRVLLIYSIILDAKKNNQRFKYYSFTQIAIILTITSLEIYLTKLFRHLSKLTLIANITYDKFKKFLKRFNRKIKKTRKNYKRLGKKRLFSLLPERFSLQSKDNLKNAFKTLNIGLPRINNVLWSKIYSRHKTSYMSLRHRTAHGITGAIFLEYDLINIETIEDCVLDVAEFIYLIDENIVTRYPDVEKYVSHFQKSA